MAARDKIIQLGMAVRLAQAVRVFRQRVDPAEPSGQNLQLRRIIERFKLLERGEHICRADTDAVVLQQRDIAVLRKYLPDLRAQRLTARHGVGRDFRVLTDMAHRWDQIQIRKLPHNGKRNKRGRMRVQDGI